MNDTESVAFILHPTRILHPILHPKSPIYKGNFMDWCRKCRRKTKNFFGGVGSGNAKHRTSLRQTSVLSRQNIGTFPQRSPMFLVSGKVTSLPSVHRTQYKCPFRYRGNQRGVRTRRTIGIPYHRTAVGGFPMHRLPDSKILIHRFHSIP